MNQQRFAGDRRTSRLRASGRSPSASSQGSRPVARERISVRAPSRRTGVATKTSPGTDGSCVAPDHRETRRPSVSSRTTTPASACMPEMSGGLCGEHCYCSCQLGPHAHGVPPLSFRVPTRGRTVNGCGRLGQGVRTEGEHAALLLMAKGIEAATQFPPHVPAWGGSVRRLPYLYNLYTKTLSIHITLSRDVSNYLPIQFVYLI